MTVIEDWHVKEPAAVRRVLTSSVLLRTDEVLLLSVWRTSESPERWKGLVEWQASFDFTELDDLRTWEAAVAWCERTAQALEMTR